MEEGTSLDVQSRSVRGGAQPIKVQLMRKIFKYVQELTLVGGMEDTSPDVHKAAHTG